ncbi:putative nmra-like family protein [Diplodia seriata]|uniref:Putative nmra-like family protein n=1 Tax=Diplodia seriata TaxID=420778 RepID=A0A0G2GWC9_9PEZI|nr:putative nmra-like family protein [Diplodia seriata]
MVNVAIAGGTGDLGRIIVDALQKYAPHHRVFILSRKPLAEPAPATTTTTTLVVDYTSIPSLTHTLTASSIHTIISTLGYHGTALSTAQLNLIHAAASSPTTFRFAPSAWAVRTVVRLTLFAGVRIAGIKFKVVYDDVEKLKRGEITELPGHAASYEFFPKPAYQRFMAIFEQFTTEEAICAIPPELNARFPEIKPLTVRAMLEQYWGEKQ